MEGAENHVWTDTRKLRIMMTDVCLRYFQFLTRTVLGAVFCCCTNITVVETVRKFNSFYETWKFSSLLKRTHHWTLSWASSMHLTFLHPISLTPLYILYPKLTLLFLALPIQINLPHVSSLNDCRSGIRIDTCPTFRPLSSFLYSVFWNNHGWKSLRISRQYGRFPRAVYDK